MNPSPELKLPVLPAGDHYAFHTMVKPSGSQCNIACSYCFYLHKAELLSQPKQPRMDEAMLAEHVRQYIEAQTGPEVVFTWQGGEPTLMGLDFFRRVVALQRQHARPGQRVLNDLQTNGLLLDEDWCRFLKAHDFLVGISIDGPADLHDQLRHARNGKPTFQHVMRAIERLRAYGILFNALCVVNRINAKEPLRVYRFLRDEIRPRMIQFLSAVEPLDFRQVAPGFWGRVENRADELADAVPQRTPLKHVDPGTSSGLGAAGEVRDVGLGDASRVDDPMRHHAGPRRIPVQLVPSDPAEWSEARPTACGGAVTGRSGVGVGEGMAGRAAGREATVVMTPVSRGQPAAHGTGVTDWTVEPLAWGEFLSAIWREWLLKDFGRVFVDQFENTLSQALGHGPQKCTTSPICGKALAIEHNGDLYACDHFVYPAYRLGNIREVHQGDMAFSERQRDFGYAKHKSLPEHCRRCSHLQLCWGECPKNRFIHTPDGEPGLNYLCAGLKRFYRQVTDDLPSVRARLQLAKRLPDSLG
ncbi:MAG: anaerobic sulfatase maturase [Lautropia sp.]|nr:anaerobic sulfatase maturase [Lautropia sp.]